MKPKYILKNYDRIIFEIKNPKIIFSNDLTPFLKSCSSDSFLIHQVDFNGINHNRKYIVKNPIHNLHPTANKIKFEKTKTISKLEQYIPKILKELNLPRNQVKWYWCTNKKNTAYIIQDFEIEDLCQEQRFFLYCYHTLRKENQIIQKTNKEIIFKLNSKAKIEQYIHHQQLALENLTQHLINEINPKNVSNLNKFSIDYDKIDCFKITYIFLEKLHHFIEKEFKIYLNLNSQIPYRSIFVKELINSKKLHKVKTILFNSNINDKLIKLIQEPFLKIENLSFYGKLTYFEFNFCSEIINELHTQIESEILTEEKILNCLFDLNFNSIMLFKYITDIISQELEPIENNAQKIYELFRWLKVYNQKQCRNTIKYKTNLPPIKKQITGWVEEEINYLNKITDQEKNQIRIANNSENNIKFLSVFSVAQLSCFFGLLLDTNIIDHKNQADVIRFIARNFKTKNTDKIAIESLRTKFHNVESSTKKVVNDKVIEILKLTKD